MDFFPDLGEPGFLDELFYLGPLALQIVLGVFFFWLLGRWRSKEAWLRRGVVAIGLVLAVDLVLLAILLIIFGAANPSLVGSCA